MSFLNSIHSQLRLPDTAMRSNNMQWDFWKRPRRSRPIR